MELRFSYPCKLNNWLSVSDFIIGNTAFSSPLPVSNIFNLDLTQGHGFRSDLVEMLAALKPRFLRFPGMQGVV